MDAAVNLGDHMDANLETIRAFLALPHMFSTATSDFGSRAAWAALRATARHGLAPHGRFTVTIARDDRDGAGGVETRTVICCAA